MKKCPDGHKNWNSDTFCHLDGKLLSQIRDSQRCPKCDAVMYEGQKYCTNCGHEYGKTAATGEPAVTNTRERSRLFRGRHDDCEHDDFHTHALNKPDTYEPALAPQSTELERPRGAWFGEYNVPAFIAIAILIILFLLN